MGEHYYAGLDIGTSRVKLHVYDESGVIIGRLVSKAPLHWVRGRAWHDPLELKSIINNYIRKALNMGARIVGISLYRASISSWKPGGDPLSNIILWLDREVHYKAYETLPLRGRIASRIPPYNKILNPTSPLPVISYLHRNHPDSRVWTLDSLIHEWVGAGYTSEPTGAALTGLINPRSLKPLPLASWLSGLSGLELPVIGENILSDKPGSVGSIISDQQSALLAVGCRSSDCYKLSLGTGFFADRPVEGPPPLFTGRGLIPLVHYRVDGRTYWAIESYSPGAGLALEPLAGYIGGFEVLHSLRPESCRGWEGSLILPYPAGPGAGVGLDRVLIIGNPALKGRVDLACSMIAGIVMVSSLLLYLHGVMPSKTYLTGSIAGIPLVRELIARITPGDTFYCETDPTPLGAALLASRAVGGSFHPDNNCISIEGRGREYSVIGKLYLNMIDYWREGPSGRILINDIVGRVYEVLSMLM